MAYTFAMPGDEPNEEEVSLLGNLTSLPLIVHPFQRTQARYGVILGSMSTGEVAHVVFSGPSEPLYIGKLQGDH